MSVFSTKNTEATKVAGLATIGTALVSFAVNKMIDIELNFWMLFAILIVGIGTYIYMDIRSNAK